MLTPTKTFQEQHNVPESLGGNGSVRFPTPTSPDDPPIKPLLIFGQDECIVPQYLMSSCNWVGPNGEQQIRPKTNGEGLMLSGYQSREFGFNYQLSQQQLATVNEWRRGKEYHDKEDALEVIETFNKQQH